MLRDETEERSLDRVGLWRRLDSPGWAAALTAAVVLVFVVLRLAANGGDPSAFVVAGDRFVDPRTAPAELTVREDSSGYDGAFVYRLALDPFTDQRVARGMTLDNPAYRQQRIGLPVTAWLVAAATPLPLPLILILVNALALVGAGWFGARFAQAYGRHASLGVLVAISPGLLIGLARDLNEPLAWLGLLAGLWWWRSERYPLAVAAFSAAALTRETTLVVVAGVGVWQLVALVRGGRQELRRRLPRILWLLVPLACALAWQGWLYGVWGRLPVLSGQGNIGVPPFRMVTSLLDHDGGWLDTGRDAPRLGVRPAAGAGAGLGARRAVLPGRDRGDRGRAAGAAGPPRRSAGAAAGRDRGHGGGGRGRARACPVTPVRVAPRRALG